MYYITDNIKPSKRKTVMAYLTDTEIKEVIQECGDSALILYEYYVRKGNIQKIKLTDDNVYRKIGWTKRKTGEIRRKLEKAGYVAFIKDGNVLNQLIGKDNVNKYKEEIIDED